MSLQNNANIKQIIRALEELQMLNIKKDLINVVGSPLTSNDNGTEMTTKLQDLLNTFANNLTNKGQVSTGSEGLKKLIDKVENMNLGKKSASGNIETIQGETNLRITNLDFIPKNIIFGFDLGREYVDDPETVVRVRYSGLVTKSNGVSSWISIYNDFGVLSEPKTNSFVIQNTDKGMIHNVSWLAFE